MVHPLEEVEYAYCRELASPSSLHLLEALDERGQLAALSTEATNYAEILVQRGLAAKLELPGHAVRPGPTVTTTVYIPTALGGDVAILARSRHAGPQ